MGGTESISTINSNICCPKCPLTPIISIGVDKDDNIKCEYRCPFMHFGQVPFQEIFQDKENKHGTHCDKCQKTEQLKLVYCGTCKQFFCPQCKNLHDKEKESHTLTVPLQKVKYTCLEHGKKFTSYCFTCLVSICSDCDRHKKHCVKLFKDFEPDVDFLDNYKFYMGDYPNYIKSVGKLKHINKTLFESFKKRNNDLRLFAKSLYEHYYSLRSKGNVNGEMLINLLNVICFDYHADKIENNDACIKYLKNHLILSNRPISDICTFSKTKSDYKIKEMYFEEVKDYEKIERTKNIKCSPFGHIVSASGNTIYFDMAEKIPNFKIEMNEAINFYNIINKIILCVCSKDKIFFYELKKTPPFYTECEIVKCLDIFYCDVLDIIGNINSNLYVRTKQELLLVKRKVEGVNIFSVFKREKLEDVNEITQEEIDNPNNRANERNNRNNDIFNRFIQDIDRPRNRIKITLNKKSELCAIVNNCLVSVESGIITARNTETLEIIKTFTHYKNRDFSIFNGQILLIDDKNIIFYSLPNFENVSKLNIAEKICSVNFVNPKMMIIVTEKSLEQYETNTWKRLSRSIEFIDSINNLGKDLILIGVGKKLFVYNKKNKTLFKAIKNN